MSTPLVVICAVGLTPKHLGEHTPCLRALAEEGFSAPLTPVLPAVTTTAQTSMLTGVAPSEHGIVANGWYFRELGEVWLWRQSQRLVDAPLVWQGLERDGHPAKVLKHFWWYAMNTDVAATVTPRPIYHADGRKSPDFYAWPPELKNIIQERHGTFPLFRFWGPTANGESTRWIADSFCTAWDESEPDLALCYLPHLDYDLQRFGPDGDHLAGNLQHIDDCCKTIIDHVRRREARILVVSEYGIEAVDRGVAINQRLRERGLLSVTRNAAGELLDPGTSRSFAVCDHQLAHVYCADQAAITETKAALSDLPGIERLYDADTRQEIGLGHDRSGELIALAEQGCWFQYEYWLDDSTKPDFAHLVEIHKKPGYDPRELLFDPAGGRRRAGLALIRKKLGLRYLMNAVPLDPSLIKGSHGRAPSRAELGPVVIGSEKSWASEQLAQTAIAGLIRRALTDQSSGR